MLPQMQNYDKNLPCVFRLVRKRNEVGIEHQLLVTSSPFGYRRMAELIRSDPDFFSKRTREDDPQNSVQQVVDIGRAMDFLLAQPDIHPNRFALVGHDFGGMYGVLAGTVNKRPTHYVIMAATPRFPDWYLYATKLEGEARGAFIRQMAEIDPTSHVGK